MRLGLFGKGRMGRAIAEAAGAAGSGFDLAWQTGREAPPAGPVDCAIDASSGQAVPARLEWALANRTPLVIGSTGWRIDDLESRVASRIGVLVAPNFSITVAFFARMTRLLAAYAAGSEDRDPYIVEHHHARKQDAPSGTAKLLAGVVLDACPRKKRWVMPPPEGALAPADLSVSAVRAGSTFSSHVVGFDSPGEVVELHHSARNLSPYARGALAAAQFIARRKGVFAMDAVAAEILDPLFGGKRLE